MDVTRLPKQIGVKHKVIGCLCARRMISVNICSRPEIIKF